MFSLNFRLNKTIINTKLVGNWKRVIKALPFVECFMHFRLANISFNYSLTQSLCTQFQMKSWRLLHKRDFFSMQQETKHEKEQKQEDEVMDKKEQKEQKQEEHKEKK